MKLIKINNAVSMYTKPVFGSIKSKHRVMSITIDKSEKKPYIGLVREIIKSKGSPDIPGFIDESKLIIVESQNALKWKKIKDLKIIGINKIIKKLSKNDRYFIGLEDPDIYNEKGIKHVYFTIAFKLKKKTGYIIYLGHAKGNSLESLKATKPVLFPFRKFRGFKEVAIAPVNKKGFRMSLSEVQVIENNNEFSAIAITKSKKIDEFWKYQKIAINPRKMKYKWCKSETSPAVFLPKDFFSLKNKNLIIGIINGREQKKIINGKEIYGKFRPGLILYNIETGNVPWIASKCLFEDPDARTITFVSDFLITGKKEGILYAHINDSFIRGYRLNIKKIEKLLPRRFSQKS